MNGQLMQRRSFITLLGGAAAAWPLAARAQQPAVSVIGFLHPGSPEANASNAQAFRKGLSELGYVEGQNLTIEYRWAMGQDARLPELAADLARRRVAVLATPATIIAARAAQAATTAIPIVFSTSGDPVEFGLVASLNRPGGNITGITNMNTDLGPKRIGLMHELLPKAMRFGVLVNPHAPTTEVVVREASAPRDLEAAFRSIVQKQIDALLVSPEPLFFDRRFQIITLAAVQASLAKQVSKARSVANKPACFGPVARRIDRRHALASLVASSKVRSQPTYRSCARPSSSWS
jgi:ABC transporter substrate binding protein